MHKKFERFWAKVNKHGPIPHKGAKTRTRCHQWIGAQDKNGYGQFKIQGKIIGAHRFVWALKHGWKSIEDSDLLVCHKCDNPGCVRYSHLFRGGYQDNMDDCCRKGRSASGYRNGSITHPECLKPARGDDHGRAVLNVKKVIAIRNCSKRKTQAELAAKYGVARATIGFIVRRETWKHV